MLGIVFQADHHVAIFNLDKLALGNIAYGVNSWRGDRYEPTLRRLIAEHLTPDTEDAAEQVTPAAGWTAEYNPYTAHDGQDIPAWQVFDENGHKVAETNEDRDPTRQEAEAKLIAAAPDLRTALRRAIHALNRVPSFLTDEGISSYRLLPQLEAVLQKASSAEHSQTQGSEASHG